MSRKLLLLIAAIVSLAAQTILFAAASFPFISSTTQTTLVPALFILVIILYFIVLNQYPGGLQTDWIFPALQAVTVIGLFLLLSSSGVQVREGGLLLGVVITMLTTYALYTSSKLMPSSRSEPDANALKEVSYGDETVSNEDALNEQINSLTRQLFAEKYRNTQLILLNELSQQLEAELDPPVSAQLAVNTLERAMDCSLVALFVQEPDTHEFVVLASAGRMTNIIPPGYRQDANSGLLGRTTKFKKTNIIQDTRTRSGRFKVGQRQYTFDDQRSHPRTWTCQRRIGNLL